MAEGAPGQRECRSPAGQNTGGGGHGPRVSPGTEAGGARAGGPSLQGRRSFLLLNGQDLGRPLGALSPPAAGQSKDCESGVAWGFGDFSSTAS